MNFEKIKKDFPIFKNNKNIVYLDSAATAQKPECVIDAIRKYYEKYNSNIHRGAYSLSIKSTELYNEARKTVTEFINAKSEKEIIFTKNATESINLIANTYGIQNIKADDRIVLSIMEHHSNLVPWQMLCKEKNAKLEYMYLNDNFEISDEEIESKIVDGVKIVAITHVSNVLGTINPVKKIIEKAHSVGAVVVMDASQSVPHMKVDVQDIDADFVVFSGHKMMSETGVGVLYVKEKILDNMNPFIYGGDMIEYVYEQDTTFAEIPTKYEAGTQNIAGVISLKAAIDYLNKIGMDNVESGERELSEYLYNELNKLDFIEIYGPKNLENRTGVYSFNIKGVHPHDVATVLDSKGVCVRSGNHCAQPLLKYIGVDSTCRASLYIYNTKKDIDKLIEALKFAYSKFEKWIK